MGKKSFELNDYEVLGVGAKLRQDLMRQHSSVTYILKRHHHDFLPLVLEQTLTWLRPEQIEQKGSFDKATVLKEHFRKIFPVAISHFGDSALKVFEDYLQEMPWEEGLVMDHFRYFPEFIRRRFSSSFYYELFQWEWIQSYLSYVDLGPFKSSESGIVKVNPSLLVMSLSEAQDVLNRPQGLFAFVYSSQSETVVEKCLSELEAEILDMLAEDRKFSRPQLIEMLQVEKQRETAEIVATLESMFRGDMINA